MDRIEDEALMVRKNPRIISAFQRFLSAYEAKTQIQTTINCPGNFF